MRSGSWRRSAWRRRCDSFSNRRLVGIAAEIEEGDPLPLFLLGCVPKIVEACEPRIQRP